MSCWWGIIPVRLLPYSNLRVNAKATLLASALGALCACSTSADTPGSSSTSAESESPDASSAASGEPTATGQPEELKATYFTLLCEQQLKCPIPGEGSLLPRSLFQTVANSALDHCLEYYLADGRTAATKRLDLALDRVAAGALEVNPAALATTVQCLGPIEEAEPLFLPLRSVGESCQLHEECIDAYCDTRTCPGACVPQLPLASDCGAHVQCESGLCDSGTCTAQPEPVFDLPVGDACSNRQAEARYCGAGLWCNETDVCQSIVAAGEPCADRDAVCEDGHLCAPDNLGEHRCARVIPLPLGAACDAAFRQNENGELHLCDVTAIDNCVDGTCTRAPQGSRDGDSCTRNDLASTCAPGLHCDWADATCKTDTPVGQVCTSTLECQCVSGTCSDVFCDFPAD